MDELEIKVEEEEDEQLLDLTLSLVSHTYGGSEGDRETNNNENDHDLQIEMLGLLQHRDEMLRQENTSKQVREEDRMELLLLKIATSVDEYNISSAISDLIKMYKFALLTGNSEQRVAAYFADGLTAKLVKQKPKEPTSAEEFLAFTHLYRVSPCYQFSHFTANQAILEAFEREEEQGRNNQGLLHVVDFDLAYGFQWPSLVQSLSDKATTRKSIISLRITGFTTTLEELVETEARLVSFAKGFNNIVFEFQGLLRGSNFTHNVVKTRENETLAVNLVTCLHSSRNKSAPDSLNSILDSGLHPSIVVLVQRGGGRDLSFPANLMDSLHYYTAMFDSLDDCLPRDSLERLCIERNHLGKDIKNAVVDCFREEHDDKYENWQRLMEDRGLRGITLSSRAVMQAKLLLRMRNHNPSFLEGDFNGGFRVSESQDGKAISLVWQDTELVTASAWQSV